MVESNLGVIVACIPTLAPLVKYFSERSRAGTSAASRGYVGSGYALQNVRSQQPAPALSKSAERAVHKGGDSTESILGATMGAEPADVAGWPGRHGPSDAV